MIDHSVDHFPAIVAAKTLALLRQKRAILYPTGKVFRVEQRTGRLVVVVFPDQVKQDRVDENFAHELSTLLYGRPVIFSNHRGLFFQVGREIPPVVELSSVPLDLSKQPTPWSLPIGPTAKGDLWLSLTKDDSFLIGGVRGLGKSYLVHGFIQALLHGCQTEVYGWDGKDNSEYLRYYGQPHFHLIPFHNLQSGLDEIRSLVVDRMRLITREGFANVALYNEAHPSDIILPIALFIDEAAEVKDQETLVNLVKVYRAAGVHPILATNDPSKAGVICKSNLSTRISLPVVSYNDSLTILAHTGAEKLPNKKGRGLIVRDGRLVEFQGFQVTYPMPSEEAKAWLDQQYQEILQSGQLMDESQAKAAEMINVRILKMIEDGDSDTQIVRKVWDVTGGARFYVLIEKVKNLRTVTTTTSEVTTSHQK